jgi:hypothetical protein
MISAAASDSLTVIDEREERERDRERARDSGIERLGKFLPETVDHSGLEIGRKFSETSSEVGGLSLRTDSA